MIEGTPEVARWRLRVTTLLVGVALVGAWIVAGRIEDRVSGDGQMSPLVADERVRPFDPSEPAGEFHRRNASPLRELEPWGAREKLLSWEFADGRIPLGWRKLGIRAIPGPLLLTSSEPYEVQAESPLAAVPAGQYDVVLDGELARGGLQLLVLDALGNELARSLYWHEMDAGEGKRMAVRLQLEAASRISLALANWSVDGAASEWRLRRLSLIGRKVNVAVVPRDPPPLPTELAHVVNELRDDVDDTDSTWEKTQLVGIALRDALPLSHSPAAVASAMWTVASHLRLPVRLVRTSAGALNQYDSYVTTEVWRPEVRRWHIFDPYFGGYWSRGPHGAPLGVAELSRLVRLGRADEVFWHGAAATRALRPSRHYVDPVHLHAHYAVLTHADSFDVYVRGTNVPPAGIVAYREGADVDLSTVSPDSPTIVVPSAEIVRDRERRPAPSLHASGKLRYADEVLLERTFRPRPVRGRSRLTISLEEAAHGYVAVSPPHEFTLTTGGVRYELAETVDGRMISPVVTLGSSLTLSWRNLPSRRLMVSVWSAARFPQRREIASAVPLPDD